MLDFPILTGNFRLGDFFQLLIFIVHPMKLYFSAIYLQALSSVIRQKDKSQNRCFKKTKLVKFSEKRTFLTPCVSGGKKCSFFGKFDVLCFLETPVLRFVLLSYYRRFTTHKLTTELRDYEWNS